MKVNSYDAASEYTPGDPRLLKKSLKAIFVVVAKDCRVCREQGTNC